MIEQNDTRWIDQVLIFIVVICLVFTSQLASASDGFTILYKRSSWMVIKFHGQYEGASLSYCAVRSGDNNQYFEFLGGIAQGKSGKSKLTASITTMFSNKKFNEKKGTVGYSVGESAFFLDGASFRSKGITVSGPYEASRLLIKSITRDDGAAINVHEGKFGKSKVIASFPAVGMKLAMHQFDLCVRTLQ